MKRSLFILILFTIILNNSFGQTGITEKEILDNIIDSSKTCDKVYLTDKTDSLFIKQFQESIKQKDNWIFNNGKSRRILLTKIDKLLLLKGLDICKKVKWTDSIIFSNYRIIPFDSIFKFDYNIDQNCLQELQTTRKNIKVLSFSNPIYFDNEKSFVIYIIEIGIDLKRRSFYYADYKLKLYKKTKENKWTFIGNLYSGFACNG